MRQPHFANARSIRNALDRARMRQATRLFESRSRTLSTEDLMTIEAEEIRLSRVFEGGIEPGRADEEAMS
jgi:AAA lid domain